MPWNHAMNLRIVRLYDLLHRTLMLRNARIEFCNDTEDCGANIAL